MRQITVLHACALHTSGSCAQLPLQLLKFYRLLLQQNKIYHSDADPDPIFQFDADPECLLLEQDPIGFQFYLLICTVQEILYLKVVKLALPSAYKVTTHIL
jgi:hypothetical protein